MFRSIRWTLQLWHGGILALALAVLGGVLDAGLKMAYLGRVDAELESAARTLAAGPLAFISQRGGLAKGPPFPGPPDSHEEGPGRFPPPQWWSDIPQDALHRLGQTERDQPYFIIWAADGTILRASSDNIEVPLPEQAGAVGASAIEGAPSIFRQRGEFREVIYPGPFGTRVLVGKSMRMEEATIAHFRLQLFGAGLTVLAVGLWGGWILSKRAIRPIEEISATARSISGSDLSKRIVLKGTQSELGSLAQTLNATFSRLETAFERQVRFTADASHELRTPLSVVHSRGELALTKDRTPEEYRQTIEIMLRATRRMRSLVESLLALARSDARQLRLNCEKLDLRQLAEECIAQAGPAAREKNVTIAAALVPLEIESDRTQVSQLLTNLLANAIQYNRLGGRIEASIANEGPDAVIRIADTGVGIAPDDQPRIFERFFRVDKARSREAGGVGLGLAICRGIATALGGSISFTSQLGTGTTFVVRLPRVKV